jgi:hypothetical protein
MDRVEQNDYLSHLLILTEPSGMLGIISIPLFRTEWSALISSSIRFLFVLSEKINSG